MRLQDFDYKLPSELIAQHPLPKRTASKLLVLAGESGQIRDLEFPNIIDLVSAGDVFVFNDTKVIPARLYGRKATGGRVEFLLERVLDDHTVLALAGSNKPLRVGQRVILENDGSSVDAIIVERRAELLVVRIEELRVSEVLERFGQVPLPPYIHRSGQSKDQSKDRDEDRDRYQTVYSRKPGAVAAPTAGLHFDEPLMTSLRARGVNCVFLTLHVGAGTFRPIRERNPLLHRMHPERVSIPDSVCETVMDARAGGKRIIAVGTTSVRALETLATIGNHRAFEGETELFLCPGKKFHLVDAMITNFHLPQSSLLMLVCAFAGTGNTLAAYRHAVRAKYRFYSYGDAMFVSPQREAHSC
jgi:S-adenosylmethionine:tRNA ribosyltransferase-isomerase